MKRCLLFVMVLISTYATYAAYQVGDIVNDFSFTANYTDGTSYETSLYEQIDNGKPVLIFWGESW
ncbi:MAG: hypothetical protein JXR48_03280 [Candidatus Delongbacteria bacterium]|nr:hypothetical protein [Candidatus Delongbacteria bacterium]MBN2833970.1 hypothetical protein [Candidatus Delongbacteria bacterium]